MGEADQPVKTAKGGLSLLGHSVRFCFNIVAGLTAVVMLLFVLLVWRLSEGPVSIAFLAPYISQTIEDAAPGIRASFKDTILVWAGWERNVDVRILDLQISSSGGETVTFIPETAFSLSGEALLRGQFAASELEFFSPTLTVKRAASGALELGFGGVEAAAGITTDVSARRFLGWLSDEQGGDNPAAFLDVLKITDADIIIEDRVAGRSWVTPDASLAIRRNDDGFSLGATLLATIDDTVSELLISGTIDSGSGSIDVGVSFDDVNPAALATLSPATAPLARVHVPTSGLITVRGDLDGNLNGIDFDLMAEQGDVALPAPFDTALGVEKVKLAGGFDAVVNRLRIDELTVDFVENSEILLPGIPDHPYRLKTVSFQGSYQDGEDRLTITEFGVDDGEINLIVSGLVDSVLAAPSLMLDATISSVRVEALKAYWPASVGEDAYNWVIPHFKSGMVDDFRVSVEGSVNPSGGFDINNLDGSFAYHDVEMFYLDEMPKVTDAVGTARFDHDRIDFAIERASSYDMTAEGGTVSIYGISGEHEQASIRVPLKGSFRHGMELVDREPLGYAKELGIDPATVEGTTLVDLEFDFPLLLDLGWEHVSVHAKAFVEDVNIPDGLFDLDVRDAAFDIDITNDGMDVIGDLKLEGYATNINWNQRFDPESVIQNSYTLNVWVDEVESLADLGIETGPFAGDLVRGDLPLWVNVTERRDGVSILNARADLTNVEVNLAALEWDKPRGIAGEARAELRLKNGTVSEVSSFTLNAPELSVDGHVEYDEKTLELSKVEIARAKVGRSDLKGLLIPRGGGTWDADFSGASLDLAGLWDEVFESDLLESGDSLLPSLTLSAQFDRVWLSDSEHIDNLTSAFVRESDDWRTIYITTVLEDNEPLAIKLAPAGDGASRTLTMRSKDAGAVLRFLRINDNVTDGDFSLTGMIEDGEDGGPIVGKMQIEEFRVLNAPTLTKVVSVMSLTGIIESLGGEGLYFSKLDIPFSFDEGVLTMTSAQANGPSLGFTANGKIYTHANVVDIQGTVVPAYMINSLLGNIPIIGNIFSGGEAGGGIFAVRYSMTGSRDDPDVSVKPLSALTPGFLRNLFGIFDGEETTAVPPG